MQRFLWLALASTLACSGETAGPTPTTAAPDVTADAPQPPDAAAADAGSAPDVAASDDDSAVADVPPAVDASAVVDAVVDVVVDDVLADAAADATTLTDAGVLEDGVADSAEVSATVDAGADAAVDAAGEVSAGASGGWTNLGNGLWSSGPVECKPGSPQPGVFTDIAQQIGVDLDRPVEWPEGTPLYTKKVREGGGTAIADFDGDGVPDLYFAVMTGPDRLYLSAGKGPLNYTGVDVPDADLETTSAVAADFDNDGDPDVLTGGVGFQLLRNDGGGKFKDVTGTLWDDQKPLYSTSVADFDRDGVLDFAIMGHKFEVAGGQAKWPPPLYDNWLYRGKGGWVFEDVSTLLPSTPQGVAFMGTWFDHDGDGDEDLYIVNDFGDIIEPNHLFDNQLDGKGGGSFVDVSLDTGLGIAMAGMGAAVGDLDHDGDDDLYLSGKNGQNYMMRNEFPNPAFMDYTFASGTLKPKAPLVSWGTVFLDYDNDGWLDLFYGNGWLPFGFAMNCGLCSPAEQAKLNPEQQADLLLHNTGKGTFVDVSQAAGVDDLASTRSAQVADLDGDGFLELITGAISGPPRIYHNGCNTNAWVEVHLVGKTDNRQGVGARVRVWADGVLYAHTLEAGSTGLWGSNEPMVHLGLGQALAITKLEVHWPSGQVQTFNNLPVRQRLKVVQQ